MQTHVVPLVTHSLRQEPVTVTTQHAVVTFARLARSDTAFAPVILAGGAATDPVALDELARHLHEEGFEPWILAGYEGSASSYESFAAHQVSAALRAVEARTGGKSITWLGHGMAGLFPWMFAVQSPREAHRLQGVVSLASQTTHAGLLPARRTALHAGSAVARMFGLRPSTIFPVHARATTPRMLAQWVDWNSGGTWIGDDGRNYEDALGGVHVPALVLAGGGDAFLGAPEGCRRLFLSLGTRDKSFVLCARSSRFLEDYTHAGLVSSPGAREEIWPLLAYWLKARGSASPLLTFRMAS
jgi:hypothetical protein